MNTPELRTRRLILRRFTPRDMDALFRLLRDAEVNRYLPWFPMTSLEETEAFYEEKYARAYRARRAYAYAICLQTDDIPIGYVGVSMEEHHDLGYGLRKEFWGQGIVTEAGRAVIDRARDDGLAYITATHDRNNPASGRVMRKLGMDYRYSYVERWQPKDLTVVFRMYQLNFTAGKDYTYMKYWNMYEDHFIERL